MNKRILCGACNEGFSELDALLARQLSFINGLIGVRPDRGSGPLPARVDSPDGPLAIDRTGALLLAEPRLRTVQQLSDGSQRVSAHFADERQYQAWRAQQKAAGVGVHEFGRGCGQRFLTDPIKVEWSFGGSDAFREIGRIALNFLAHRWPEIARLPTLRRFKDWVQGLRKLEDGEPCPVWYAREAMGCFPECAFPLGHQIALALSNETATGFAQVRLFGTYELLVSFAHLTGVSSEAVVFDIDPLAEHPPHDVRETAINSYIPETLPPPTNEPRELQSLFVSRMRLLFERIGDRQWALQTDGLVDALNATRRLARRERVDRVSELLSPHAGRVLRLMGDFADRLNTTASDYDDARRLAALFGEFVKTDRESSDGLTDVSRMCLGVAQAVLADAVSELLECRPLDDESLRALLGDQRGADIVGRFLIEHVVLGKD